MHHPPVPPQYRWTQSVGIATAYAKEGANLVLTGRNVKKLTDAKEELESKYGIKVLPVQADISAGADNEAIVAEVVKQTIDAFMGGILTFVAILT